jgi:hypothetical protein
VGRKDIEVDKYVRNKDNPAKKVSLVRKHGKNVAVSDAPSPSAIALGRNTVIGLQDIAGEGVPAPQPLDDYRLKLARMWITDKYPFYAKLLYRMPIVESRAVDTLAVDKYGRIYVNPDYVNDMPIPKYSAALIHEFNHFLRDHHGRFERRWGTLSNLAGDCEINDDLDEDKNLEVDPNWIFPDKTFGLPRKRLAEEYFNTIPRETTTCPDCGRKKTKYIFVGKEKIGNKDDTSGKGMTN